jgi:hypothetical protein
MPMLKEFSLDVTEYRRGTRIGFVIRDMQVTVKGVCLNNAPSVSSVSDTCIFANENVDFQAFAQDDQATVQDNPILHWEYFGEGFFLENNPATFVASPNGNPITGDFHWQPGCEAVRNNSYIFTLEATDAGPNDFERLGNIQHHGQCAARSKFDFDRIIERICTQLGRS